MQQPQKFIVSGFNGLRVYCKITSTPGYNTSEKNHTISFGGKNFFCLVAMIKASMPTECYIDRVEYNSSCVVNGSLREKGSTAELVKLALWTIVSKFPQVTTLTLTDDSYIYCEEGSKLNKLSLSHDFILKYNKTWYQYHFNAELPTDQANTLKNTLKVLDQPLEPFEFVVQHIEALRPYRTEYESSPGANVRLGQMPIYTHTPRAFMNTLRDDNYCFTVGKWIEHYMKYIGIRDIFKNNWFIRRENVVAPPNYHIAETQNSIRGGYRGTRKRRNYSLIVHNSCGGYDN
jgi:hypothetical protein